MKVSFCDKLISRSNFGIEWNSIDVHCNGIYTFLANEHFKMAKKGSIKPLLDDPATRVNETKALLEFLAGETMGERSEFFEKTTLLESCPLIMLTKHELQNFSYTTTALIRDNEEDPPVWVPDPEGDTTLAFIDDAWARWLTRVAPLRADFILFAYSY